MKYDHFFRLFYLLIFVYPFAVSAQIGVVDANAAQKPKLVVLGTYHFDNPGRDVAKSTTDDVLKPNRQKEIEELIERLQHYQATKIAVECSTESQAETSANYEKYLSGNYTLTRNEIDQIGFRLAKKLNLKSIYCIDWNKQPIGDIANYDYADFAEKNPELKDFLQKSRESLQKSVSESDAKLMALPVVEQIKFINDPAYLDKSHQSYFKYVRIGLADEYVGANYLSHWYGRNMKIFANLIRITDSPSDRILVIYGAGHAHLLSQFARESGYYEVENLLKYLK